ncbi:MAG: ribosome-associated translation inhibitor RaiA [Rhodospirillaceae bacterium]|nr:ribosome-associated translation inhibitor RaiA [Rhodospirillaceae bacterium]
MDITVNSKQMDVGESLRSHSENNLNDAVSKYFDRAIDATVTFSKASHDFFGVEITVHAGRGLTVHGHGEASDAYPAFDQALERVAKQLRRYKRKLVSHHQKTDEESSPANYAILATLEVEEIAEEDNPTIIAEMAHDIVTLSVSEAVMRLDLGNLPVVMFKNGTHGGLNVVYRRTDGNVGWIDPATVDA